MGTNYYATINGERWHIGKSSAGWCLALHVWEDGDRPRNLSDWMRLLLSTGAPIEDEYGHPWTFGALMGAIVCRDSPRMTPRTRAELEELVGDSSRLFGYPCPVNGPHGLIRHGLGADCIGHGEGTWDLLTGDFS